MSAISRVLTDANAALFMLLALASIREYRRGRGAATAWAATAFVTIGAIATLAFLPVHEAGDPLYHQWWWQVVVRFLIAMIVAFPYFLYRIAATLHEPSPSVRRTVNVLTGGVIAVGFLLPRFPGPGEPRPTWLIPYSVAIVLQWTVTSVYAAGWMWRSGAGRPTVARNQMRLLAIGTAALNVLILASSLRPQNDPQSPNHVIQVLDILTGVIFFIGLAPPLVLVERWRRHEQEAARAAMSELMTATTAEDVATRILPHVMAMVGAESAALYKRDGDLFASYGELVAGAERDDPNAELASGVLRFPLQGGGSLVVRSTSYSSLFGGDKISVLKSFADLLDLALGRCALLAREREFISNAAHELRTPLTTMTGLSGMLETDRDRMTPAEVEHCISAIVRQGARARSLVDNLLDMAQIERGTTPFADDDVALSDVISDSLELAPAPEGRTVRVDVPAEVHVRGDADRLQQVVVNLVTNAYHYGGPTITIDAHAAYGGVVLSVSDDGEGVPSVLVPNLFDPFSRAPGANGTGSGLGLAICRRIVHALGGSIDYDPNGGHGARFNIALRKAA